MTRQDLDLVQIKILNDQATPYEFVVDLLESVFGRSTIDARLTATTAHHFGEGDCGLWPAPVAEALLKAAQAKIDNAGHRLALSRSVRDGHEVVGQDTCLLCDKPEAQARSLYRSGDHAICDACILNAAEWRGDEANLAAARERHWKTARAPRQSSGYARW